jgi:hypothetical protein
MFTSRDFLRGDYNVLSKNVYLASFYDFDIWFDNWSDSVVLFVLELVRQCGVVCFSFY